MPRALAAVLAVFVLVLPAPARGQRLPVVAAAADLQFALRDIADRFAREEGQRVELVFGSSGAIARQIREGAPYELFLSADEAFVDQLVRAGLTRGDGVLYGVGRLVLFAPAGSPLDPRQGIGGLACLLDSGQLARFAIANPEHAPYGRAAEAVLRKHGLWDAIRPRLVFGENATQTAQFAASGNSTGGMIPLALALAPAFGARGTYVLIPEEDHPPLRQRMVLLRRAGPVAQRFYDYLQQPPARAILRQYGFVVE